MKHPFARTAFCVSIAIALSSAAAAQQSDPQAGKTRFIDLLSPGQTVSLKANSDHALYTIKLLNDEQKKQADEIVAGRADTETRLRQIEELLPKTQDLAKRGSLLKEQIELEGTLRVAIRMEYTIGNFYVVASVGADYVALKKGDTERFVPMSAIRYMYRSAALTTGISRPYSTSASRGGRSYSSRRDDAPITLKHTQAGEMAEVIKKLYPDFASAISFDTDKNTISLDRSPAAAQTGDWMEMMQLIDSLDTEPTPTTPAEEK